MRLGTCIALELAVAASAVGGVCFGVVRASDLAGDYLGTPEVSAATLPASLVSALPSAELRVPQTAPPTVFGAPDAELLAPLAMSKVTRVKLNQGGTSISLRIDFENGTRAAFKPEQIHLQSDPRREIAAFRIDRMLGIWRVPPAKPAAIPVAQVMAAIDPAHWKYVSDRITDETTVREDGMLHGEVSWWIPEIKYARIGRFAVDEREGRELWQSYLQVGAKIPAEVRGLVEQIATCILFDVLIDNDDRWSGNNTVTSPDGKIFYIMDNTMSFSLATIGHEMNVKMLHKIQVFPRGLVERMRKLTEQQIVEALVIGNETKLGSLLHAQEIRAVIHRRDNMMKYVDQLIATHGEDSVLALP